MVKKGSDDVADERRRILFKLTQDEDGYPPDDWESLWAVRVSSTHYRIDNIPFFVKGVSVEDVVSVRESEGDLFYKDTVAPSNRCVVRVVVFDLSQVDNLRNEMHRLGCESEASHIEGLIAFDVPSLASMDSVLDLLQNGENKSFWEFEEACVRD